MEVHTRREVGRMVSGMISAWKKQVVKRVLCAGGMTWQVCGQLALKWLPLPLAVPGAFYLPRV